jgi:hypothetical protein
MNDSIDTALKLLREYLAVRETKLQAKIGSGNPVRQVIAELEKLRR